MLIRTIKRAAAIGAVGIGIGVVGCDILPIRGIESRMGGKDTQQHATSTQEISGGHDVTNISPVFSVNGNDAIIIGLAAAGVLAFLAKGWLRQSRIAGTIVQAIEAMPEEMARPVKDRVAKAAYQAGVSQEVFTLVQKEFKRALKAQYSASKSGQNTKA